MTDDTNFSLDVTFNSQAGDEGRFDVTLHNISPDELVLVLSTEALGPLAASVEAALAGGE